MKIDRKQIRYSLQLLVHFQKNKVTNNQDGYAMLITSILAILMFSMLSVYLFSANLYKSVANAVVDSGSTFYAAESGMNRRANLVRDKFEGYSQPTGTEPDGGTNVATQMQNCISNTNIGTNDLACNRNDFDYKESQWKAAIGGSKESFESQFNNNPNIKYRAYSFVKRITTDLNPALTRIPPGEDFAGLNMQEYKYRLYSTAMKRGESELTNPNDFSVAAQTLLQMDFNSRIIPLFQFAAFYEQDLEITSSSNMALNGAVHSNSNIWFGNGGTVTAGQLTAAGEKDASGNWIASKGKIYKSLNRASTTGGLNPGYRFILGSNSPISVGNPTTGVINTANTQVTATEIANSNGLLRINTPKLDIPGAGLLDTTGNYFTKADLQVEFDPDNKNNTTPHPYGFGMKSVQGGTPNIFTDEMLRSLRQPVMLVTQAHSGDNRATEWSNLCIRNEANFTATAVSNTDTWSSLTTAATTAAATDSNALRDALAKSSTIYTFSQLNGTTSIGSLPGDLKTQLPTLTALTPRQIANKAGNCFLPAPMLVLNTPTAAPASTALASAVGQTDRQENRLMKILQSNIHSLTVWNRDGRYSNATATGVLDADGKVFARISANSTAPAGGYEWMGFAASDRTEGGLVWHFSVSNVTANSSAYPSPTVPPAAPTADTAIRKSQFGFGFSGGRWLPGPLTLATDQIVYVQGDFNNPGGLQPDSIGDPVFSDRKADGSLRTDGTGPQRIENSNQKQPAAIMADAIGVLSNSCRGVNGEFNCFNIILNSQLNLATPTSINAAFLAGTTNGSGLNNYMRMMENWGGTSGSIFRYRGSFVSFSTPRKLDGIYRASSSTNATTTSYYSIPSRDFGYDISFNTVTGLPPLTPKAVYLKQRVFRRDYNNERN